MVDFLRSYPQCSCRSNYIEGRNHVVAGCWTGYGEFQFVFILGLSSQPPTLKTASTLTFTVYMLAEHPKILQRLREEILQKVGPQRRPTYDDFKEMKFLRAVINGKASFTLCAISLLND